MLDVPLCGKTESVVVSPSHTVSVFVLCCVVLCCVVLCCVVLCCVFMYVCVCVCVCVCVVCVCVQTKIFRLGWFID